MNFDAQAGPPWFSTSTHLPALLPRAVSSIVGPFRCLPARHRGASGARRLALLAPACRHPRKSSRRCALNDGPIRQREPSNGKPRQRAVQAAAAATLDAFDEQILCPGCLGRDPQTAATRAGTLLAIDSSSSVSPVAIDPSLDCANVTSSWLVDSASPIAAYGRRRRPGCSAGPTRHSRNDGGGCFCYR
jgi:hypothetical protein